MMQKNDIKIRKVIKKAQDIWQMGSFKYNIKNDEVIWSDKLYEIYGLDKSLFLLCVELCVATQSTCALRHETQKSTSRRRSRFLGRSEKC